MFLSNEVNDNESSLSGIGSRGAGGPFCKKTKENIRKKRQSIAVVGPSTFFKLPSPLSLMMITQNISISHDPVS